MSETKKFNTKEKKIYRGITRKNFRNKLIKIYPKCKHDGKLVNKEDDRYKNDQITYGEMNYNGIEILYKYLNNKYKNNKLSIFLDVGSGRGKLCMYMGSYQKIKKSIGIELVEERHQNAVELLNKLPKKYSKNVELFNGNILNKDLTKIITEPTFIWWSNLCFDSDKIEEIYAKLKSEIPSKSILCCSKTIINGNLAGEIKIPMSWREDSNVLIYEL